ncbi:MAG: hypothetical protein AMJ55_09960 [Gammaproteobacteria bacterium SG8_15]|nr:MAG: hypothetical protein AMJ55_09960 [Gammaproteobacteria bacterium SG8_15]
MTEQKNEKSGYLPFLEFFRYFGIILAIVVALAPMLTRYEDLLPMYAAQKEMLTFFTSLVCLLALGVLFSVRRSISHRVFPLHSRAISKTTMSKRRRFRYYAPLMMVAISVASMVFYYYILDKSVKYAAAEFSYSLKSPTEDNPTSNNADIKTTLYSRLKELINSSAHINDNEQFYLFRQYGSNDALVTISYEDIDDNKIKTVEDATPYIKFDSERGYEMVLALTPAIEIKNIEWIILSFVLIYLGSSVAFAWIGLIEYLQRENNLEDKDLLYKPYRVAKEHAFKIDALETPGVNPVPLYFKFSYDPKQSPPTILEPPSGPYIENYGNRLEYYGPDKDSEFHVWAHHTMIEQGTDRKEIPVYTATLKYNPRDLQELMYKAAYQELSKITASENHEVN